MARKLLDLFNDCTNDEELKKAEIVEAKYSKKRNVFVVRIESTNHITPNSIIELENSITNKFDLKGTIVSYLYKGEKLEITENDIKRVLEHYSRKNVYANHILKTYSLNVDGNVVTVILNDNYEGILKLKNAKEAIETLFSEYYNNNIKIEFKVPENIKQMKQPENNFVKDTRIIQGKTEQTIEEAKKEPTKRVKKGSEETNQTSILKDERKSSFQPDYVIYGKDFSGDITKIYKINEGTTDVIIDGEIVNAVDRELKNGKILYAIDVTDYTSTITCKMFLTKATFDEIKEKLKNGSLVKLQGKVQFDNYAKELGIIVSSVHEGKATLKEGRKDSSEIKRVELHAHTQMSAMDAVTSATDLIKQAIKWGHKSIAITDHGVVQAFPEAHQAAYDFKSKEYKIKVLYGVEGYLIPDIMPKELENKGDTYVVLDIETTGLDYKQSKITEIGAVKLKDGKIVEEFETFVNPQRPIPKEIVEITNITDDMVKDAPTIEEVLPKFLDFISDSILVAHNSSFDIPYINHFVEEMGLKMENKVIDTLEISREIYTSFPNHKLGTIASELGIEVIVAHRAIDDVKTTVKVFNKMQEELACKNINVLNYAHTCSVRVDKSLKPNHIIILAKNYTGLKNLYKLISYSHLNYFHKKPQLPRSLLLRYKEGLIIGSACEQGELYKAILNEKSEEELKEIVEFYDYLEIQPLQNNMFYVDKGILNTEDDLIDINKKIIALGEKYQKHVVGTCDTHFLNKEDEVYRRIIMSGMGYDDADNQAPLYFRTTEEMLAEFSYLPEEKAREIVIENTNKIADMIEQIQPVPDGTYPPVIEGAEEEIENISKSKAKEIYGDPLPDIVQARMDKELNSIIKNGFAIMYIIAQKLVKKSNDDGYLVGSRGSVGSSFVATMTGITEVNPLPAHYICENCKYSEFPDCDLSTGIELPDKDCPRCNKRLKKDGMDIPFETFLGFNGDKAPDIDLNFSGEYQAKAHQYTEVLFGKGKTFKAGTIGTVADKTAYGFVKKYFEEKNKNTFGAEINRLSKGCVGIKRTTGQHPGGIIVVPRDKEIYDFCPVQHPADDVRSHIITTHFDFHSIHDNLLKLDILGHDDPTVIRMLQDLTNVDPKSIPFDDQKVMSLFKGVEALGLKDGQIPSEVGTYAIPEFGTKFVRQMLVDTKPTTFGELLRISGLSHGTDVWLGNAQTLIEEGTATLSEAICTRDDIMIYLIRMQLEPLMAFKIMESVRKGKGLTEEMEAAMKACDVPQWYITSCKKIKYMFPKAHATAYVMMAFRIAWFKVYYPKEFYATFLTVRANTFDGTSMLHGKQRVKQAMEEIETSKEPLPKDKDTYAILEVINEMNERGIDFLPVDLYISNAEKFTVEQDGIRPPLSAITGLGGVNSSQIVKAREDGKFESVEDLRYRAKLGDGAIKLLKEYNCLESLPNSSQIDLFEA